jgi:hypothetical protein
MLSIIYTIILLASFIFFMRRKDETESNFPLKIIGYFILGSFAFHFNQVSLPIGFAVYLLFFRPRVNVKVKRLAATVGVFAFVIVHWILPTAIGEWEGRARFIEHELGSVYTINFQEENELVKQKLKLEENSYMLENFEVEYTKEGRITDLKWQLIEQEGNKYHIHRVRYERDKGRYRLQSTEVDSWLQYNRLIDANRFFENLKALDFKNITHSKGDYFSYVIRSSGERIHYGMENQTRYIVSNGEIQLLENERLPVEAYYISTYAMKKTGEERDSKGNIVYESSESTASVDYLFDVDFGEE